MPEATSKREEREENRASPELRMVLIMLGLGSLFGGVAWGTAAGWAILSLGLAACCEFERVMLPKDKPRL